MKKEKKERFGYLKKLREYWQIPRYRSLITLGLYFVFFGIIILYVSIMDSLSRNSLTETKTQDSRILFSTMSNYEYNYEIEASNQSETFSFSVSGIRYDDYDNFKINNESFYVLDNIVYSNDGTKDITDIIKIDLLGLRPSRIYEALRYSVDASKIEYQNGDVKVTYKVPVTKFNIAFLQEIDENNTDVVEITTYEHNNEIYEVDLDIYNLMKLTDSNLEKCTAKITYSNINNIKNVEELK